MKSVLYILFSALFTFAVSLAAGKLLLQRCRVQLYRSEEAFLGFISGAACLSLLVFLLTAAGLARKGVFLAAGIGILALAAWRRAHVFTRKRLASLPARWRWLAAGPFVVFTAMYLSNALAPETSADGTAYHLGLVARIYREHHFPVITTSIFASLSQGMEMLYLFSFGFGKYSGASMTHFLFLLALPFGMLSYGRRRGEAVAGALGGMLAYLSPAMGTDGTCAYIDAGLCTVLFAVFYLAQVWRETRQPGLLIPLGLCAGFAVAIKITAGLAVPYALGVLAWTLRREWRLLLRGAAVICGCAMTMVLPWLIKNTIIVGNPVSPFANRIFSNPYVYPSFEVELARSMSHFNGLSGGREIAEAVTLRGGKPQGLLGPIFLLAPLALLSLRWRIGREVVPAAILFLLPYPTNLGTRFLLPCLPFVALGMSAVLVRWQGSAPLVLFAHSLFSWPAMVDRYADPYTWNLQGFRWEAALRRESEAEFLQKHLGDYRIGLQVEKVVPPGQAVLTIGALQTAYQSREVIVGWQSAFGSRMQDLLWTPSTPNLHPTWRHDFHFPARAARRVRLVQTAASEVDEWSISEITAYVAGKELASTPEWHITASDNPWEAGRALDGKPITKWRSGRYHQPGMYVEIDFGRTAQLDRVTVDCPHNQGQMRMRLEVQDGGGWKEAGGEPERIDIAPPADLRKLAEEELKANGIHWLLCHEDDFGAADFLKNAGLWGFKPAINLDRYTLFHLE